MKIARIAIVVAVVAALLLLSGGPGTRLGLWEFSTGFLLMRWALYLGIGAAALALVLLLVPKTRQANTFELVAAIVIGLGTAWVPWSAYQTAQSLPFIHDISTDTENPPSFVDIVSLRADAPNPHEYQGEEIAQQQREGYPDIQSLDVDIPATQTFERALAAANKQGWDIVASAPEDGRIEASATTLWYGFIDDVVIRVAAAGNGSRLDIRSKSRVGGSDVGANAARIRAFIKDFEQ